MSAAPLLRAAARALRGGASSSSSSGIVGGRIHQTLRLACAADPASDQERRNNEASLYETGALNPRDYGYAHPHLEAANTADQRGVCLRVSPSAPASVLIGATLLLARPLAFLDAPEDHQPSPDRLADVIAMKRLWQTPAAATLQWDARPGPASPPSSGGGGGGSGPSPHQHRARAPVPPAGGLVDLAAMPHWMLEPSSLADGRPAAEDVNDAARSLVATNAYGDDEDDLPAAALRRRRRPREATSLAAAAALDPLHQGGGGRPRAVAGVWPAFSLLNHSCAPTCVHYCVGSTMVVRAAADLRPGDEATVSYLAREVFAPLEERRRALSERYGFLCRCARCEAEARLPAAVREAASGARQQVVGRLRPRFEAAVEAGDGAVAAEVAAEVSSLLKTLEEALERGLAPPPAAQGGKDGGEQQQQQHQPPQQQQQLGGADGLAAQAVAYEAYELAYFASALAEASLGAGLEEAAAADGDEGVPPAAQLAEGEGEADRARRASAYRGARHAATAALARCALVLDGVARGSEVHVLSAHALLRRATRQRRQAAAALAAGGGSSGSEPGNNNAEAAEDAARRMQEAAAAIVSSAHEARYGASGLPDEVALGLLEASKELADEYF